MLRRPARFSISALAISVALALLALLPVGLAANYQPTEVSGPLSVLGFGLPDEIATVRVEQFKEQYSEVELNLPEGSLDKQQFLTAVVSGNAPDLIYTNRADLSTYATRGAIVPLETCIEQMDIDLSQYRDAALGQVTIGGHVYGIPEFFTTRVVIMNNDVLADAGLTPEDVDIGDWQALAAINEKLTRVENGTLTRIGFDPKLPEFFPLWVRANGGRLLSEDGRTATLNSPEAVEALEFAAGLHEPAGGRQKFLGFRDTWDFFGASNEFAQDQLGGFPMEVWYVHVLAEVSPDVNITVMPFLDRQGQPLTFATGGTWAIPRGAKNLDAACAFMKTMTATDTWFAAAQARSAKRASEGQPFTGLETGNKVADDKIFSELVEPSGNPAFDHATEVIHAIQDDAFAIPANPAGAEFQQAWTDAVNRVLNGEQSAQESLDQAQREAQEALDEAWSQ